MHKESAKHLKELFELSPIDLNEPGKLNDLMKHGLADMYANAGFKSYMDHCIQVAVKALLESAETPEQVIFIRGKISTLKQLLKNAETWYTSREKLNKIQLDHATK